MKFAQYDPEEFFDEMFVSAGAPRAAAHALTQVIDALPPGEIERRQRSAERALLHMGITFNVYGDDAGTERIFPFDLVPAHRRRRPSGATIERGLKQRIHALNLFIDDIYHEQRILKDGVVPAAIVLETAESLPRAVRRAEPAARHLVPHHRHRPGARRATASSTCSKTTCAARPACRTCWRTGR